MLDTGKEIYIGMKVAYVSGDHGDQKENPLWGGKYGRVYGIITSLSGTPKDPLITVEYPELGTKNTYCKTDLDALDRILKEEAGEEPERIVQGIFNI